MSWIQTTDAHFQQTNEPCQVLLVIAHPDDEVMFFAPLLQWAQSNPHCQLSVLCLSTGNFAGLGHIRTAELLRSTAVFGVALQQVTVVDHALLQDGMENAWSVEAISALVEEVIGKTNAQVVFSFDHYGVSGHPNHIASAHGVRHAVLTVQQHHRPVTGYQLVSKSLLRKYAGVCDILLSLCLDEHVLVSMRLDRVVRGMQAHHSQFVWFRMIFIVVSCFSFVNTFSVITK
jgi:N-acetylglucosaminylphosphatidylinositol deacetylase